MVKHYIVVDEQGKMVGYQMTPGEIVHERYVEVTPEVYQQAMAVKIPYEGFRHIGGGQFELVPDSRPVVNVTASVSEVPVNESAQLQFVRQDGFTGSMLVEYDSPSRAERLIQLNFTDGVAVLSLTCSESGVYRFAGGKHWRVVSPVEISVFEV